MPASAGCRRWKQETSCADAFDEGGRLPTIEPILPRQQLFSAERAHCKIAHQRLRPAQPIDAALFARSLFGPHCAQASRAFIAAQGVGRIVAKMREEMR